MKRLDIISNWGKGNQKWNEWSPQQVHYCQKTVTTVAKSGEKGVSHGLLQGMEINACIWNHHKSSF